MNVGELFDGQKEFMEAQDFMDVYGIRMESEPEERKKRGRCGELDFEYVIKFSIPEAWEPPVEITDVREIQKRFKEGMVKSFKRIWVQSDFDEYEDKELEKMMYDVFKFMCRTRKGETWTHKDREHAQTQTRMAMEEIANQLKMSNDFIEV